MIVGGYAVAFHGLPRLTKNVDVFYDHDDENISRVRRALMDFGFPEASLPAEMFQKGHMVVFGVEPLRVDLLNQIDGVSYAEAKPGKIRSRYGEVEVDFIGLDQLLKNKRSTGRPQDALDADLLAKRLQL